MTPYIAESAGARDQIDGGYYCKTRENRPLIGPLPVDGAFVLGALSGFGVMAAHASAELLALARHRGNRSRTMRDGFCPSRYEDRGVPSVGRPMGTARRTAVTSRASRLVVIQSRPNPACAR